MSEQGTAEWFADRLGKVTASRIADVMMKPTTAGFQNYQAQLVCERLTGQPTETFTSAAMQHGTDTEPRARAMYELTSGNDVEEVGFIPHPTIEMSGASPDGIIGSDGLVEIKCPQPATHIKTLMGKSIDRKYLLQMQWQMVCTGREWCDFVSFCPSFPPELQLFIARVDRDAELAEEITEAVTRFLASVDQTTETLDKISKEAA
ncbi:lambda exonuclease family protein [Ruegeria sp. HKCCA4812]|uniref:lambda exonuclease family protein n=1 Tax=Ruegeria sp. HKCCA4812 TaxID=2682993 RepID=UPI0014881818|nr:lambda exonuclease family protein [Ruegeria sp. HKCCA4812]